MFVRLVVAFDTLTSIFLFIHFIDSAIEHGKLHLRKIIRRIQHALHGGIHYMHIAHTLTHSGTDQLVPCQACEQECKNFAKTIGKILLFLERMRFDAALMHTHSRKKKHNKRIEMKITHTRASIWLKQVRAIRKIVLRSVSRTVRAAFVFVVRW